MNFGIVDIFIIFLITMGPLKSAIVYTTLTAEASASFRRLIAIKTVVTATIITILFVVIGDFLLEAFHITLPALKLGGGLILLIFALEMVMGGKPKEENTVGKEPSPDIAIFPLAMPLMATPQGLVAIITVAAARPGTQDTLMIIGAILAVMAINFIFLLGAHRILGLIGASALKVVGGIMGLLLVALAIQLMLWGLTDLGVLAEVTEVR